MGASYSALPRAVAHVAAVATTAFLVVKATDLLTPLPPERVQPVPLPPRCIYCRQATGVTKEHLVPRSVGGTKTLPACRPCNQARGCSGAYPPFRRYISDHPDEWAAALATVKPKKYRKLLAWLFEYHLL